MAKHIPWQENLDEALTKAKREHKYVLRDFFNPL